MEKKTTKKKTTRKKTTKRKRTTKAAEAEVAETAADAAADQPAAAAKKTKKTTRKRKTTKKKSSDAATVTSTKKSTRKRTKRSTKSTKRADAEVAEPETAREPQRVEGEDGAVVIRFPPVAPSPFSPSSPEPAPAPTPDPTLEPSVAEALDEAAELRAADEDEEADGVVVASDAQPAEKDSPRRQGKPDERSDAADDADDESGRRLSRSQKRRLRRKRRAQASRDEDQPAEAAESETAAAAAPADDDIAVNDDDEAVTVSEAEDEPAEVITIDEDDADAEAKPKGRRRRSRRRRRRSDKDADEADEPDKKTSDTKPPADEEDEDEDEDVTPAGKRQMIINFLPHEECRIAILENGKLEEIYLERASYENHVGSIYKGIVTNVEPSIQAAFIDFGLGKNGFLHITDLHPDYMSGSNQVENVGRKMPRRSRPPIQKCLRRGQEVIVQITKEGIGTKGPTLSTYLSIPGRFLVMMPGMRRLGISRKIEEEEVRGELRDKLKELKLPDDIGFIARTAANGRTVKELQNDLNYLERLWRAVERRQKKEKAPTELYRESDLVVRTIRDVFASDVEQIIVDDPDVAKRAQEFLSIFSPKSKDIVIEYDGHEPIFHKYKIEDELERLHSRRVPLDSGGSLVIDSTEALVAIDVNSGRFRTEDDAESTAFKLNLEAAEEIARQLRLRDLGGVVVCDFIDMRQEKHKRKVERTLINALKLHKERAKVLRMSEFGLLELTRQRQRASLTRNVYQDCTHCRGGGLVKTPESVVIDIMRTIQYAATRDHVDQIEVVVNPEIANQLQNRKRATLYEMEQRHNRKVTITPDPKFGQDQIQVQCYDQRGRVVPTN